MRDRIEEVGYTIWIAVIFMLFVSVLTLGGLALYRYTYPAELEIRRMAVEESKSFTDSNNTHLTNLYLEYNRLETKIAEEKYNDDAILAYRSQQEATLDMMCRKVATMNEDTVDQLIKSFLAKKGAC